MLNLPDGRVFNTVIDFGNYREVDGVKIGGAATLGLAMVTLLFGINQAGTRGWAAPIQLGQIAVSAVMFAAFVWLEARLDAPMVDLGLFRNRLFTASNLTNLLAFGAAGLSFVHFTAIMTLP